jgi:hypothetical protein
VPGFTSSDCRGCISGVTLNAGAGALTARGDSGELKGLWWIFRPCRMQDAVFNATNGIIPTTSILCVASTQHRIEGKESRGRNRGEGIEHAPTLAARGRSSARTAPQGSTLAAEGIEHAPGEHAPGEHAPGEHAPGEHAPGEHAPGSRPWPNRARSPGGPLAADLRPWRLAVRSPGPRPRPTPQAHAPGGPLAARGNRARSPGGPLAARGSRPWPIFPRPTPQESSTPQARGSRPIFPRLTAQIRRAVNAPKDFIPWLRLDFGANRKKTLQAKLASCAARPRFHCVRG